jgi:transcriptional regulator with XRE-family HTH domain
MSPRQWQDASGLLEREPAPAVLPLLDFLGPEERQRDLVREAYDLGRHDGIREERAKRPSPSPPKPAPLPPEVHDSFGSYFKAARERVGLSCNQLALTAGVNPSYVQRFENGQRPPANPALIEALGRILRLSTLELHELLTLAGHAAVPRWSRALECVGATANLLDEQDLAEFTQVLRVICRLWQRRA